MEQVFCKKELRRDNALGVIWRRIFTEDGNSSFSFFHKTFMEYHKNNANYHPVSAEPSDDRTHQALEVVYPHRMHILLPLRGAEHAIHLCGFSACIDLPKGNGHGTSTSCGGPWAGKTVFLRRTALHV